MYRYEKSGEVHGLTRVRGLTQDDSHIYCTREQMKDELTSLLTFVLNLLKDFGLSDFYLELSTRIRTSTSVPTRSGKRPPARCARSPRHPTSTSWPTRAAPRSTARRSPCRPATRSVVPGRSRPSSSISNLPERFQLEYIAKDGTHQRPVMIHRALFGSIERFFAVLLEHYAGAFPAWLAPCRCSACRWPTSSRRIWPVLSSRWRTRSCCEIDYSDDRFGKKIRNASKSKVPFILIVGEEDMNNNAVSFRFRDGSQLNGVPVDEAREKILAVIKKRAQVNSADDFAAALA